jgi:hypothetical protein
MSFRTEFDRDAAEGFRHAPAQTPQVVTEDDLAHLPDLVQRYLRYAGVVGRPRVWNYRVRFVGEMRGTPTGPWMPAVTDQLSFVDPPVRLFLMKARMFGLPVRAFHRFVGPSATFRVRVAGLLTMVDAKGPEMNRSETVTRLNDMCLLAPATLIGPDLAWEAIDESTVRVTFTSFGNSVSALLTFDAAGALTDFSSEDRMQTADGKTYVPMRWSTPIAAWREFHGRRVASDASAVWHAPTGEYAYGRFEVVSCEYNVESQD